MSKSVLFQDGGPIYGIGVDNRDAFNNAVELGLNDDDNAIVEFMDIKMHHEAGYQDLRFIHCSDETYEYFQKASDWSDYNIEDGQIFPPKYESDN